MHIPKSFKILGQEITVKVLEIDEKENRYGYYNDAKEEIVIFRKIKVENEIIELTNNQLFLTLFHEVIHAFQFHALGRYDEQNAQTFSGLIMEFLQTSGIKLDPNLVHEPIIKENNG